MGEYTGRPGIDWGAVAQGVGLETGVQNFLTNQKEQAIRWQGEQDYQTLTQSGIEPMEALRRTAPKLFHNDPRGLANAIDSMRKPPQATAGSLGGIAGVFQPGGHWTPLPTVADRPEARTIRESTPATPGMPGVSRSFTEPEYKAELLKRGIASEQGVYNAALEKSGKSRYNPTRYFGPNPEQAMATSSNRLAMAGMNAQTGKEFPPSQRGASGGFAPPATPESIAKFTGSPTAFKATNAPPSVPMAAPTSAQAQAAFNAITPPAQNRGGAISAPVAPNATPAFPPPPPLKQRKIGSIYTLPGGNATWTEDGWVPVPSVSDNSKIPAWMEPNARVVSNAGIMG